MARISLLVVACLCVAQSIANSQSEQNQRFDRIVSAVSSYISSNSLSDCYLGNVNYKYVNATSGVLKDISSLKRVNDATVTINSGVGNIKGAVTFNKFEIDFDYFLLGVGTMSFGGCHSTFGIKTNQIDLDIDYRLDANSTESVVTVNQAALSKLGGFTVKFKTFSMNNWLFERLAPALMDTSSSSVIASLNNTALADMVETALKNVDLSNLL